MTTLATGKVSVFEPSTAQRQAPAIVEKVLERVSQILTANELHFSTGREQESEDSTIVNVFDGDSASDLVLGVGVGLDHRFNARWIAGVSV
ncbi:MAG: hypothetical protein EXR75_09805 [Myxococcales bacterium]|nr:hypothetical protein [Myxococcales bacterium]